MSVASDRQWPVKPPDEHRFKRWHWLLDEQGDPYLADWDFRFGWHWGWPGAPKPEDMEGWTYVCVADPPGTKQP